MTNPPYYRNPIPESIIGPLHEQGLTHRQIAQRLGVDEGKIDREMKRYGLVARIALRRKALTPEQEDRIRVLAAEGMPSSWIAEDVGHNVERIRPTVKTIAAHDENVREWQATWASIRNQTTLVALHEQFAASARGHAA